jgi:hypothetical protein
MRRGTIRSFKAKGAREARSVSGYPDRWRSEVIARAIFVLTGREAGEQFLKVLPDLREMGLSEATILHLVSAKKGPAEPMPDLANWVRHFESAIPKVELALKRGNAVKWIYELARVRHADIVVISDAREAADWDLERISSPLRSLGIPILYLPECGVTTSLSERVLVAIKSAEAFDRALPGLVEWFGEAKLEGVHVASRANDRVRKCAGVTLRTIRQTRDVATSLSECAAERGASLVALLADDEGVAENAQRGVPVVRPYIEHTDRPVLIWPIHTKTDRSR